jgi:hypothetical protein
VDEPGFEDPAAYAVRKPNDFVSVAVRFRTTAEAFVGIPDFPPAMKDTELPPETAPEDFRVSSSRAGFTALNTPGAVGVPAWKYADTLTIRCTEPDEELVSVSRPSVPTGTVARFETVCPAT